MTRANRFNRLRRYLTPVATAAVGTFALLGCSSEPVANVEFDITCPDDTFATASMSELVGDQLTLSAECLDHNGDALKPTAVNGVVGGEPYLADIDNNDTLEEVNIVVRGNPVVEYPNEDGNFVVSGVDNVKSFRVNEQSFPIHPDGNS